MAQEVVQETPPPTLKDEISPSKNRVLLVDDERITLNALGFLFRSLGWETRQSLSGKDALEILSNEPMFDLIITDLQMPGMNGFDVLKEIRDLYGPKPIVFIFSGFVDSASRTKAIELGAQMVIHKSTNFKDIYELLKSSGFA